MVIVPFFENLLHECSNVTLIEPSPFCAVIVKRYQPLETYIVKYHRANLYKILDTI